MFHYTPKPQKMESPELIESRPTVAQDILAEYYFD